MGFLGFGKIFVVTTDAADIRLKREHRGSKV